MADPIESRADANRQRLARSVFQHASLEEVTAAVAVAIAEGERQVYVERAGRRYRWSLCHRGGGYPLLRSFAQFLRVDHRLAFIGFNTVGGGWAIAVPDLQNPVVPDAWAVLTAEELTGPLGMGEAIREALESGGKC
jgi:hypothetical protein